MMKECKKCVLKWILVFSLIYKCTRSTKNVKNIKMPLTLQAFNFFWPKDLIIEFTFH